MDSTEVLRAVCFLRSPRISFTRGTKACYCLTTQPQLAEAIVSAPVLRVLKINQRGF